MGVFSLYLLVWALAYCAPLLIGVWMLRRRIAPWVSGAIVAVGFAAATGYTLYRLEWFDMFRLGLPSVRYMVGAYVPWIAPFTFVGWLIGYGLSRHGGRLISPARS